MVILYRLPVGAPIIAQDIIWGAAPKFQQQLKESLYYNISKAIHSAPTRNHRLAPRQFRVAILMNASFSYAGNKM